MAALHDHNENMHQKWMALALQEAHKAFMKGEVPVGAVIVLDHEIVGAGHNLVETFQDPTAHAEMMAITAAANRLGTWRLNEATLFVTLEPCPMCFGAMHLARLSQLIFAAKDARLGACGSAIDIRSLQAMGPPIKVKEGVMADESRALLNEFFKKLRKPKGTMMGQ